MSQRGRCDRADDRQMVISFIKQSAKRSYAPPRWTGVASMIGSWLTRKRLVLLAIAALLLVGTVLLSIPAVYSQLVSNEILGDEWQCRKIAFLLTCTRLE